MSNTSSTIDKMKQIFEHRGKLAIETAKAEILNLSPDSPIISDAFAYFAKTTLSHALPVFPGLVSMSCEAVGGNNEKVPSIGAAVMLMACAADLHDDVIDQSKTKWGTPTVFGKYGREATVLCGDMLLIQGLAQLRKTCLSLPDAQSEAIQSLIAQAAFNISRGEALETKAKCSRQFDVAECFAVVKLKAVVPRACMEVGAILGGGSVQDVEMLGQFGEVYGVLSIVAEEFIDLYCFQEFANRLKNECPPLPFVYAMKDPKTKYCLNSLLDNSQLRRANFEAVKKTVLNSPQTMELNRKIKDLANEELGRLSAVKSIRVRQEMQTLITALSENLQQLNSNLE